MMMRKLATWLASGLAAGSFSGQALAECGGQVQCIGIGVTADLALNQHGTAGLTTVGFGNVAVLSATEQTLYVSAVTGPAGTTVKLDPVAITGADANQFSMVGGTCPRAGGDGPVHGTGTNNTCTIQIRFSPTSPGPKSATLTVPLRNPPALTGRDATLTGIGGNERISPALEADVASLIAAQVATQRRFGAAQIRNISNRMDSLHRAQGFAAGKGPSFGPTERRGQGLPSVGATSAGNVGFDPFGSSDRQRVERTGAAARESGAVSSMLTSLLTSGQVPLMLATDAGARPGASDGGYWLSGILSFGRVGPDGGETRFETSGFTIGADRRISPALVVGGAAGYSRAHSTFGINGSDSRNTGQSLSLYGSYEIVRDTYIDAILGYGTLDSRSRRFVAVNKTVATSERDGSQVYGSLAISKELFRENISWAPYARLEFNRGTLDRVDETGAGISSLTYLEQKNNSSRLSLGVRASSIHEIELGSVIPHLRLEYGRELQRVGAATIAYADQPGGPTYSVAPTAERRGSALIGIGAEFLTHAGIAFGFELGTNGRIRENPEYTSRLWLSTALDNLQPRPQGLATSSTKTPFTVTAALRHDTNITRTSLPTPELSDRIWTVAGGIDNRIEVNDSMNVRLGAIASADKFQTFDRLDTASLDLRAELAYQAGGLFTSPRFGVFTGVAHDSSRSDLRTGNRFELGVNTRVQVAERTGVSGVLAHKRRRASGDIFDTKFTSLGGAADQQLGERSTVRVALEARRGDFVSSGIPAADSAAISQALADDDAFPAKRFVAYRFRGRSLIATLGYSLALGSRDSLDLTWTGIRVKPTQAPDYTRFITYPFRLQRDQGGKSPYSVQQIAITYTMRF